MCVRKPQWNKMGQVKRSASNRVRSMLIRGVVFAVTVRLSGSQLLVAAERQLSVQQRSKARLFTDP